MTPAQQSSNAPPHTLSASDLLRTLGTDPQSGLDTHEAARRRDDDGPNDLAGEAEASAMRILWTQIGSLFPILLLTAAGVSVALGDRVDAAAILVVVALNTGLGFAQEWRAERSLQALRRLAAPAARVLRDGAQQTVPARDLVAGDIVFLEAGDIVPADARILEAARLRVGEAALTGEAEPVDKTAAPLADRDTPLPDRSNMVYRGTQTTWGRGTAVVTATGMRTEIGRIAQMLRTVSREATPLQRRLAQMARGLAAATLVLVGVIFVSGLMRGEPPRLMALTALSMAVAAVPEGLPAVVTVALSLGAQKMLRRRALVRRLHAVETLGSTTVICSDKTGTLTQNRMTATVLDMADATLDLSGEIAAPGERPPDLRTERPALFLLLAVVSLCNDARWGKDADGTAVLSGDPTEAALREAAERFGIARETLEEALPRIDEIPFDSERKRMSTFHRIAQADVLPPGIGRTDVTRLVCVKGAVDAVLPLCGRVWSGTEASPIDARWTARIDAAHEALAGRGMRVLGVAFRSVTEGDGDAPDGLESELTFVGMIALEDPVRPEVRAAIATCRQAGIRPVLITGDHPTTAQHVARSLEMHTGGGEAVPGAALGAMDAAAMDAVVEQSGVFARVAPEHKLRIVEALQRRGQVVAMTGDGINDAPALRRADIGVAMGLSGTDVAREAADMVLLDDNFATIVAAVEEGRAIYDNIRKFVQYTLTSNVGEVLVMLAAPLLGMPLPLQPLQILWINLVTDGLPGLALSMEPAEPDTMRRPPYPMGENVFGRGMGWHVVRVGAAMGAIPLLTGYLFWRAGNPHWQTMVFTTLTLAQMGHALAIRSHRQSLFRMGLRTNRALAGAVALTAVLQMAALYVPAMRSLFAIRALSLSDLLLALVLSSGVFWLVEGEKWLMRRRAADSSA